MKGITTYILTVDFHDHNMKGKQHRYCFHYVHDRSCSTYLDPKTGK